MTGSSQLPRVMRLRDVVLFIISAIVGLRWLTTAASQFGLASLGLWLLAMVVFFLPSAIAVGELADIDPGAGGIYRWVRRAFGPMHGFVAGWGYWVNNLFYFPSLLVTTAAIAAYAAGPRFVHLSDDNVFIALVSLVGLWLAVAMNVVGLRVGKRLQNLGGHGTWLPGLIFVTLALWSLTAHGSATPVTARSLLPAKLDLQSINLFATMTFAFAGLELAPTLGDEIYDPARTLRRGIVVSGLAVVGMYVLGTAAMLVALPHETVSITNGMPQATAALVERLGAPALRRGGRRCVAGGVRTDPSGMAHAVRRVAGPGCDCDRIRSRKSRRHDREERLPGAHADDPGAVLHPLSLSVPRVLAAAARAHSQHGGHGVDRICRCPLLHRAGLRPAGR